MSRLFQANHHNGRLFLWRPSNTTDTKGAIILIHTQSLVRFSGQHPAVGFLPIKMPLCLLQLHSPVRTCSAAFLEGSSKRNCVSFISYTFIPIAFFHELQAHLLASFWVGASWCIPSSFLTMHFPRGLFLKWKYLQEHWSRAATEDWQLFGPHCRPSVSSKGFFVRGFKLGEVIA